MKFYIRQTCYGSIMDDTKNINKLINDYPCLKDYGFNIEEIKTRCITEWIRDEEGNRLGMERN